MRASPGTTASVASPSLEKESYAKCQAVVTCLWLKRRVWQEDGAAAAMEAAKRSLEMHGAGMYGVQGLSSAMHLPVRLQA